jgi:hypothetical protein
MMIALYPILTILGMILIIPLAIYVSDHTPFQGLNVLRPDHYSRLLFMVYRAWSQSGTGKLNIKKDL